jgi:general secretion pathway protein F/type IV pilus assembly protein PilC
MPTFTYTARNRDGESVTGRLQADSEQAVARALGDQSLFPVRIDEARQAREVATGRPVRKRDVGVFYGQLADLLRAGVPLLRALDVLARAATTDALRQVVRDVREAVAEGKTLAEAMSDRPKAFVHLHVAMVRAGERAGFLEDVLANLSAFIDRQDDLQSRIRGSMIYPAVLTVIGTGAMLFVLIALVPQFKTVFAGMPQPLPTRILFGVSDLLVIYWPLATLGGAIVVAALLTAIHSPAGRQRWDRVRIRLPLVGKVTRTLAITRFCRIFGTMLSNGVPILQALAISKDAAGNAILARTIDDAREAVQAGQPLAEPLRACPLFPPEVVEMIAVAEESNQLDRVLVEIAETIERRTNRQLDQVVRLIEPLILVVIAGAIGFVAMGLLYPIFTMSRMLK